MRIVSDTANRPAPEICEALYLCEIVRIIYIADTKGGTQSRLLLVTHDCAGISLAGVVSATTPVWFLLSHTAAAQLLANSCSPLRFAWTTGRRSARGIF